MIHGRIAQVILLAGWLLPGGGASAAADADIELGRRYIDPKHGFSLRPPAGAIRRREFSAARLVSWSCRDSKTGAIAWTLTVRREAGPEKSVTMADFAKQLAKRLSGRADYRVQSIEPAKLLGKDALRLRVQRGTTALRWQDELWLLAEAERFLVLSVSGPADRKDHLEAIGREVAATLRLIDPTAAAAARKENLARGRKLLKGLTDAKLAAAVAGEPRWYLFRRKGKDIGFMYVSASKRRQGPASGFAVTTVVRLGLKDGQVARVRRELFTSADRQMEMWSETAEVSGGQSVRKSERGGTAGETITCKLTAGGKSRTRQKTMPPATAAHYLPRAMALLLPRLVDLKQPAAYAFATYTTAANDFDMRTFSVIGPEKITLGARTVEAVRATDQVAADSEPATLWLRDDGTQLRMRTAAGIAMELSTREAVLRRFPQAGSVVKPR